MKMIPLAVPNLTGREAAYLQECVESTFVSSVGPFVDRLEAMVAQASTARFAVATSAGTTGLHASLVAVGVRAGDLVILPSLTFIASANAISHAGATPWLLDVSAESWTLDPHQLKDALASETERRGSDLVHKASGRRVAAIMPVYTLGTPADMDELVDVARAHRLPVIADAAAAIGARYKARNIGELGADLSVLSFNGNKTVTCGGGGAVIGNDETLCRHVKHLTTTARVGSAYDHDQIGFNYRMTNLQAAVGCAQMERVAEFVERKRAVRRRYDASFAPLPEVAPLPSPNWAQGADWLSGFFLQSGDTDAVLSRLRTSGIDARPFWKPVHLQRPYQDAPRGSQEVSESMWNRVVTLPCSSQITDDELDRVISSVFSAVSTNG